MSATTISELPAKDSFKLGPSAFDACVKSRSLHTVDFKPVTKDVGDTVDLDVTAVPTVPVLGDTQSPDAVRRFVPGVVVEPFDGVFRGGAFAHVRDEVGVLDPTLADGDAPASVVFPRSALGVQAAVFHPGPHAVLGVASADVGTVGDGFRPDGFQMQTPATSGDPTGEGVSLNVSRFPAVAGTSPPSPALPGREARGGCEPTEFVTGLDGPCTPTVFGDTALETGLQDNSLKPAHAPTKPCGPGSRFGGHLGKDRPMAKGLVGEVDALLGHGCTLPKNEEGRN